MSHSLIATPVAFGARRVAADLLAQIRQASARLDDPEDDEALHDFRVNIRRLRSVLRAYAPALDDTVGKKWRRRLGDIARQTNDGRDVEVHLAWLRERMRAGVVPETDAIRCAEAQLQQRMHSAYGAIRGEIRGRFARVDERLSRRLSFYWGRLHLNGQAQPEEAFGRMTGELLQRHADQMWRLLSGVTSADEEVRIHNGRVAAKRLRYLLEPLRRDVPAVKTLIKEMKRLQDTLGELNDMFVLLGTMRRQSDEAPVGVVHEAAQAALVAMITAAEKQRDERYGQLAAIIADGSLARFVDRIHRLGTEMVLRARTDLRQRRVFLLSALPAETKRCPAEDICEGWFVDGNLRDHLIKVRAGGVELRRRLVERPASEPIVDEPIGEATFARLWRLTQGRRLRRRRFTVSGDEHPTWHVDKLAGSSLVLAQVEAGSDADPPSPAWLRHYVVREVTGDPAFASFALAR